MSNNEVISSKDNNKFKEIRSLTENSGIIKNNKILISGKKIIKEIIDDCNIKLFDLISYDGYTGEQNDMNEIISDFAGRKEYLVFSKNLFNELDLFRTKAPLLTAKLPVLKKWDFNNMPGCTVILPFQNPVNIGSGIRSAAAMGASRVVILKEAANPFHPKSIRASAGTVFKIELLNGPSIEDVIAKHRNLDNLITLDMGGRDLQKFSFPENFILFPGIEGQGVPQKMKKMAVSIPMHSGVESLNASVSISIVLWEWRRRLSGLR